MEITASEVGNNQHPQKNTRRRNSKQTKHKQNTKHSGERRRHIRTALTKPQPLRFGVAGSESTATVAADTFGSFLLLSIIRACSAVDSSDKRYRYEPHANCGAEPAMGWNMVGGWNDTNDTLGLIRDEKMREQKPTIAELYTKNRHPQTQNYRNKNENHKT